MPLPALPALLACPPATPDPAVSVEVVSTARIHGDWSRVVDDGTTGPVDLPALVGIIHHPDATILVDAGLGLETRDGRYPRFPLTLLGDQTVPEGQAIVERLPTPPDLVLMTHLHYDHVGGLLDLPGVTVWTTDDDWRAFGGLAPGFPPRLRTGVDWRPQSMAPGQATQVLGRPAVDVMGDGSIWYLSLPGHTPGAAAVLVAAEDGPWLFVGDTAWVDKHLQGARRPWLTRTIIDASIRQEARSLQWARWMKAHCPELVIVPGHEPSLAEGVSSSPAR